MVDQSVKIQSEAKIGTMVVAGGLSLDGYYVLLFWETTCSNKYIVNIKLFNCHSWNNQVLVLICHYHSLTNCFTFIFKPTRAISLYSPKELFNYVTYGPFLLLFPQYIFIQSHHVVSDLVDDQLQSHLCFLIGPPGFSDRIIL